MDPKNVSNRDKKFVQDMIDSSNKSHKTEPETKAPPVDEIEKLTDSIRRRIQRGE